MVGAKGFEPSTSCSQSRCATRLRHAPKKNPRRCGAGKLWGERWDLNPRPPGPQPGALPTELLPPRENSYKQVILVWQAFFPQSFIWILSRKVTTLPKVARRAEKRRSAAIKKTSYLQTCSAFLRLQRWQHISATNIFRGHSWTNWLSKAAFRLLAALR